MPKSLSRNIKRHLWAPTHTFTAVVSPGLEAALADELAEAGFEGVKPMKAGVEFTGRPGELYRANLMSRISERLWWRIMDLRDRGPALLEGRLDRTRWEFYLYQDTPIEIIVSGPGLKLSRRRAIEKVLRRAVAGRRDKMATAAKTAPTQRILVRLFNRRWHISLDSSGERLHRRGYRLATAKAPIRETLAAAVLRLAGYDPRKPLWDPMCGAGTFAVEAAMIARNMAPGPGRSFNFQSWPNFRPKTWKHLLENARSRALDKAPAPIMAADLSAGAVKAAKANAQRAGVRNDLLMARADFFEAGPPHGGPGLVVINPPYGRRVQSPGRIARFYEDLGRRLIEAFADWRLAVVVPEPELEKALDFSYATRFEMRSGGRTIALLCSGPED